MQIKSVFLVLAIAFASTNALPGHGYDKRAGEEFQDPEIIKALKSLVHV